ncbi:tyrosine-protein phosphatase siw14 [Exophiala dermatitidis]|uniref:diphosphoinositol-polyphosphate diphosphatase n=2 Tax=Exophiala dermatitidis TaxID=5970 RepID=H6C181_EXODN
MGIRRPEMPNKWAESDEFAATLAALRSTNSSATIDLDKSQPPTPDGSGRPVNFQVIAPGLYRSSYPLFAHFETLADLELKTIVTLVPEPLPFEYENFISSNGIIHHHIPILANKKPDVYSSDETVNQVVKLMLDPANYPMLVHCNKGKHRSGTICAAFRKVTGWTLEACIEEYERYSTPKDRELDKVFIERYDASVLKPLAFERGYIGGAYGMGMTSTASTKSSVYTANTVETALTSDDSQASLNDYQERVKKENDALLESARLWSYK